MPPDAVERYPFGRPVRLRPPSAAGPRPVFVLGAYPSALHVAWRPPPPWRPVRALPVDDLPEPFWPGRDQREQVEGWKRAVRFDPERWGEVSLTPSLNGNIGVWVEQHVLRALGIDRGQAWLTQCVDRHLCGPGVGERVADTYAPFAAALGLPLASLRERPPEPALVEEALREHAARLAAELEEARPELVITLGNTALTVARALLQAAAAPERLSPEPGRYGGRVRARAGSREVQLLPLAHPAAPAEYQVAHAAWVKALGRR